MPTTATASLKVISSLSLLPERNLLQDQVIRAAYKGVESNSVVALISSASPFLLFLLHNNDKQRGTEQQHVLPAVILTRGGSVVQRQHNNAAVVIDSSNFLGLGPKARSVVCMAIAMSLHYFGYSFARPSSLSIFTSSTMGYGSSSARVAFPLAMSFVSPTALALLMGYTKLLDRHGPRGALTKTTMFCATVMCFSGLLIMFLVQQKQQNIWTLGGIPLIKFIAGPLFVFRESYVQLITSQYWSFMASILTPAQSAKWFAPISGLTSITSALAGINVSRIVRRLGLPGAIVATGVMMFLSLFATSTAYSIAERNGFSPKPRYNNNKNNNNNNGDDKGVGMLTKATKLFQRVPTLWALFCEILAAQGLATLLNVCFVTKLSSSIPNDAERAGWMGNFFALINVIAMTLQFGVLPHIVSSSSNNNNKKRFDLSLEPRQLWRVLPLIMLLFVTHQCLKQNNASLWVVSASLLAMKTLEYSARRMLDEMVYVPLDFESRYVGKEVIGVFGYRFGKSVTSLVLSGVTALCGGQVSLAHLSYMSQAMTLVWLSTCFKLARHVPTQKEASVLYDAQNK